MKRLGLLGFPHNSGLGTLSLEFVEKLKPTKVLLAPNGKYAAFPERFPLARSGVTKGNIEWLLDGIDTLLTLETPVNWDIYKIAKKRGIKTFLIPMYECMPHPFPAYPDVVLCPSKLDYKIFKSELREHCLVDYLNIPVNRDKLPFRQRQVAKVFQFNAGHGGLLGRNGITELLAAIPMCKSDARFIIYSQKKIDFSHPKVDIRVGNFERYEQIWQTEADVFIFPHKFDGLSLPIQEALSVGMPVLSTAIFPFFGWLPNEWFFPYAEMMNLRAWDRMIEVVVIDPADIAAKIDEWYGKDIRLESKRAGQFAAEISWETLLLRYKRFLL